MNAWKTYVLSKTYSDNNPSVFTQSQIEQIESDPKTHISYYLQPRSLKPSQLTINTSKSSHVSKDMWYRDFPSVLLHMIASYLDPISGYKMLNMFGIQLSEFYILAQTLCAITLDDIRSDLECTWINTILLILDYFPLARRLLSVFVIECCFLFPNGKALLYSAASLRNPTAISALILSFTENSSKLTAITDFLPWVSIWANQCKSDSAREFLNKIAKNDKGKSIKSETTTASHQLPNTHDKLIDFHEDMTWLFQLDHMCYPKKGSTNDTIKKIKRNQRDASTMFNRIWEDAAKYPPIGCAFITLVLQKSKFCRSADQRNPFVNFIDNTIYPINEPYTWRQWQTCTQFVMALFLLILTNIREGTIESQDYLGYDRMKVVQCIRFRLTEFMFQCYSYIRAEHFPLMKNEGPLFKSDCARHIIDCQKLICQYLEWLVIDHNQLMTFGLNENDSEELKQYNLFVAFYLFPETTFHRRMQMDTGTFYHVVKYQHHSNQSFTNIIQQHQFDFYSIIDRLFIKLAKQCEFATARLVAIRDMLAPTCKTAELDILAHQHNNIWAQQILCDRSFNSNALASYMMPLWYHCMALISGYCIFPNQLIHPRSLYTNSFKKPILSINNDYANYNRDSIMKKLTEQCCELFNPIIHSTIDLNVNEDEFYQDFKEFDTSVNHQYDDDEVWTDESSSASSSSDSETDDKHIKKQSNTKQKESDPQRVYDLKHKRNLKQDTLPDQTKSGKNKHQTKNDK